MKKCVFLFLLVVLLFSFSVFAFAYDIDDKLVEGHSFSSPLTLVNFLGNNISYDNDSKIVTLHLPSSVYNSISPVMRSTLSEFNSFSSNSYCSMGFDRTTNDFYVTLFTHTTGRFWYRPDEKKLVSNSRPRSLTFSFSGNDSSFVNVPSGDDGFEISSSMGVYVGSEFCFLNTNGFHSTFFDVSIPFLYNVKNDLPVNGIHFVNSSLSRRVTINYKYLDGSRAASSHSLSVPVGTPYIVPSPAILGYTPSQAVVSGDMPDADLTINVTYSPLPYELSVDFLNIDGDLVAPAYSDTVLCGTSFAVPCPKVVGYTSDVAAISGVMPPRNLSLSSKYSVNLYKLTVRYVSTDGAEVYPPVILSVPYNSPYSIDSPIYDGYSPSVPTVSGIMPARDFSTVVTYDLPKSPLVIILEESLRGFDLSLYSAILPALLVGIFVFGIIIVVYSLINILRFLLRF